MPFSTEWPTAWWAIGMRPKTSCKKPSARLGRAGTVIKPGVDSGRGWLRFLRRRVVDRWRRRGPVRGAEPELTEQIEVAPTDPLANDYTDEMQRALDRLPSEIRETLLLVVVGELTHQEVADLLKIPLGTVLSRVSRGRVRLREFWLTEARMNAG